MASIYLGQGVSTLIDEHHLDLVETYRWHCAGDGYAQAYVRGTGRRDTIYVYLHGLIAVRMGLVGRIDHHDLNKLNNLEENLREATRSQNAANQKLRSDNVSGVKGVSWYKAARKWQAYITVEGKRIPLGLFSDLEEAREVRRAAAFRYFGEFARED